jgi:hypothetical protein
VVSTLIKSISKRSKSLLAAKINHTENNRAFREIKSRYAEISAYCGGVGGFETTQKVSPNKRRLPYIAGPNYECLVDFGGQRVHHPCGL